MNHISRCWVLLLVAFSTSSIGRAAMYTSETEFLAALQPGYITNTFAEFTEEGPFPTLQYSDPTSYTIDAPLFGLYNSDGIVSTGYNYDTIVINFADGITAVGANFYNVDLGFDPSIDTLTLALSDGTTEIFTSSSIPNYRGFTTDVPISWITLTKTNNPSPFEAFPALDNLTIGTVPEPHAASTLIIYLATGYLCLRNRSHSPNK